ncbi:MAG: hypothetical protein ABI321_12410 [Polyangia bacterium]
MRLVLFLLCIPCLAYAGPFDGEAVEPPTECAKGVTTSLWRSGHYPLLARHDGPEGATTFEVRAASGRSVGKVELPGRGRCLGWSPVAHAFLVGSIHEIGVVLPMPSLELVAEDGKARATALERDRYAAYALVTNGRFVAFVSYDPKLGDEIKLYALELATDRIRELGPAPAPPPDRDVRSTRRWRWGVEGEEGFMDLEPDVLRFDDDDVLRVSYGKDTSRARSKQRVVRTFRLGR